MNFSEAVSNRISCRSYNGEQVSDEDLAKILEVMQVAPTAAHYQAYRVRVTIDLELIAKVGEIAGQEDRFEGATAMIVFLQFRKRVRRGLGIGRESFILCRMQLLLVPMLNWLLRILGLRVCGWDRLMKFRFWRLVDCRKRVLMDLVCGRLRFRCLGIPMRSWFDVRGRDWRI